MIERQARKKSLLRVKCSFRFILENGGENKNIIHTCHGHTHVMHFHALCRIPQHTWYHSSSSKNEKCNKYYLFIWVFFFDRITTNSNAHIRFEYIWALVMRCTLNRLPSAEENCTKNKNESLCSRRCCTVAWLVVKPQNRKPHITKHDIQRVKGKSTEALILFFSLNFSYGVGCDIVDVDSTHTHRQRRSSCMRTRKICLLL